MATKKLTVEVDVEVYACVRMNVRFLSFLEDNGLKEWDRYDQLKSQFLAEQAAALQKHRNSKSKGKPLHGK
ncbi:MAG: hypothetical protein KGI54_08395 [Pseudomonadota bacterium]|nr:hypothetical protein [Pseudomonadota bacterium]